MSSDGIACRLKKAGHCLSPGSDDPNSVNQSRNVTKQGQQDVQPELEAKAHLEEHPHWRNDQREYDSQAIHRNLI
jgi:hypothetical protein